MLASLVFLLGALLVAPIQGQTWADFQRKHIDSNSPYPPANPTSYCNNMMRYRGLTNPFCRTFNTFINAQAHTVQQVCQSIMGPASITSSSYFNLVNCRYINGNPPNYCNYQGIVLLRRIRVTCEMYVPVHFIGTIP